MPPTTTTTRVVHTEKRMEHFPVVNDLVAYRITTTTTPDRGKPTIEVTEGLTSSKGIKAFARGAVTMPQYRPDRAAVIGTPEFQARLRSHGWIDDDIYEGLPALANPFTRLQEGTAAPSDVLFVESGTHMVFNGEGQPVPVAILFSYINAQMDNLAYDLKKAVAILKARDDIRFVQRGRHATADDIQAIPGYNQSDGRTLCISFVWMPSVEDYRRMWDGCLTIGGKYPMTNRYRAVFEHDLLGLRRGGAARFRDFYSNKRV